ncbi:TetR family transcriptional regulator [Micropruina sp.]|uniref:TetR family transcriptional regulator n=1 Tax=Micropruina sp. TaxID=2737536 RepID=UPI0039E70721
MVARPEGLRERKKARTRASIAEAAMTLFAERGFDQVTVAEIAHAVEVSVATVFNYFPTKEDLFFDRQDEVVSQLANAVRARQPAEPFVDACRRDLLNLIDQRDWRVGLAAGMGRFYRMVADSPSLQARSRLMVDRSVTRLTSAIAEELNTTEDDIVASSTAWILVAIQTNLLNQVQRDSLVGLAPEAIAERLTVATNRAFDLLQGPIATLGGGTGPHR